MSAPTARAEAREPAGAPLAEVLGELLERFDGDVFDARRRVTRVRLSAGESEQWDAVISDGAARLAAPAGRADATVAADARTWRRIARDASSALEAYRSGRLTVRRNMHVGVGLLAATSGERSPGRLRFQSVQTRGPRLSIVEAGRGTPVLAVHGLGATKGSFLTSVLALARHHRVIAYDQPGFGDSDKPIGAPYDARYLADSAVALMDALDIDRAHLIGNSLGGRVALEIGLRYPSRVRRIGLLAPSLAWRRGRPLLPLLRLLRPELGLVQVAPRPVIEGFARRMVPDAEEGWAAAGVDEFLRAYLTRPGRAAFYAAARHIYLEEPDGAHGFWTRLGTLRPPALFVWGRHDRLVPLAFERHVEEALPSAEHLELDCGHVPQIELPGRTHRALVEFFARPSRRITA